MKKSQWRNLKKVNIYIPEDIPVEPKQKICKQCFNFFLTYEDDVFCKTECKRRFFKDLRLRNSIIIKEAKENKNGCEVCGYNKWLPSLEWHHVYPESKENEISNMFYCLSEEIRIELNKCILLCCNCHREIHSGNEETVSKVLELANKKG